MTLRPSCSPEETGSKARAQRAGRLARRRAILRWRQQRRRRPVVRGEESCSRGCVEAVERKREGIGRTPVAEAAGRIAERTAEGWPVAAEETPSLPSPTPIGLIRSLRLRSSRSRRRSLLPRSPATQRPLHSPTPATGLRLPPPASRPGRWCRERRDQEALGRFRERVGRR
jgi:hypothetical protein